MSDYGTRQFEGITSEVRTNKEGKPIIFNRISRNATPESYLESMRALTQIAEPINIIAYFADGVDAVGLFQAIFYLAQRGREVQSLDLKSKLEKVYIVYPSSSIMIWIKKMTVLFGMDQGAITLQNSLSTAMRLTGLEERNENSSIQERE